jgi:hypothetical protein
MQAVQLHGTAMRRAWRDAGGCSHLQVAVDASNTTRLHEGFLTVPRGRRQSKVPTLLRPTRVHACYVRLLYVLGTSYCCT